MREGEKERRREGVNMKMREREKERRREGKKEKINA
jgi:hypothetical protein